MSGPKDETISSRVAALEFRSATPTLSGTRSCKQKIDKLALPLPGLGTQLCPLVGRQPVARQLLAFEAVVIPVQFRPQLMGTVVGVACRRRKSDG